MADILCGVARITVIYQKFLGERGRESDSTVNSQRPCSQSICLICLPVASADWEKQLSEDKGSHNPFIIFKAPKGRWKASKCFLYLVCGHCFCSTMILKKEQPVLWTWWKCEHLSSSLLTYQMNFLALVINLAQRTEMCSLVSRGLCVMSSGYSQ